MTLQTIYRFAVTGFGIYAIAGALASSDVIAAGLCLFLTLCFFTLEV
jgi:hypothetical protein